MLVSFRSLKRRLAVVALSALAALAFVGLPSSPVRAQGTGAAIGGVGQSDLVTVRATVKAVDQAKRTVTLVGPHGDTLVLEVAGNAAPSLAQVNPGDVVVARYYESTTFVLQPGGMPIPQNTLAVAQAEADPRGLPADVVASRLMVSGVVVAVDPAARTLSVVNAEGGQVRKIKVTNPQNQQLLSMVNVGDTITAFISEAVAVSIQPAK